MWGALMLASVILGSSSFAAAQPERPTYASREEVLHGRIRAISGQYDLQVSDERGFIDNVRMHKGTVINPTGLALAPGMSVTVLGYAHGSVFEANEIDTPYTVDYPVPAPVYPYYGYYGPYYPYPNVIIGPGYGYGWGWHEHYRRHWRY
jgi:hypothetical protein